MKRVLATALLFLVGAAFSYATDPAGPTVPSGDVLGAHLMYGRGCVGCHAPHSGPKANGGTEQTGAVGAGTLLWGEDVSTLPATITFGPTDHASTLTLATANEAEFSGIIVCLSCHDGNAARPAMMKGTTLETLQIGTAGTGTTSGGVVNPPTFLAADGGYANDHPVGPSALYDCAGSYNWTGCTFSSRGALQAGTNTGLTQFKTDYGLFVSFKNITGTKGEVTCTSCHNQHNMSIVNVTASNSGMTAGTYATMFFLVGPYSPNDTKAGSNSTAQFCRQCHGYGTTEALGGVNPTVF